MTTSPSRTLARAAAGIAIGIVLLQFAHAASGAVEARRAAAEAALLLASLVAGGFCRPFRTGHGWIAPRAAVATALTGGAAAVAAAVAHAAPAAALALVAFWALALGASAPREECRRPVRRGLLILAFAAVSGAMPMAALELECGFAHEELFVASEALLLAGVWLVLRWALPAPDRVDSGASRGARFSPRMLAGVSFILGFAASAAWIVAYQNSFSTANPPRFDGVSAGRPFLCGTARPDPETYDARRVFHEILEAVAANPQRDVPEYGMLALATKDLRWARRFRDGLRNEIGRGRFTRHVATKFWQYEAALRAYYYPRILSAFPGLFSADDRGRARAWFAAVNRRADRVGLDDVIYAIAYRKRPEGPYENQENGAALLAAIEAGGLAPPDLSAANRRYLDGRRRGWQARFRNSDDSFTYQSEWITNAFLQALRSGAPPRETVRRSFEWLLLQTAPDGFAPNYNPSIPPGLPSTAYLGATLLHDPELLFLAGRAADNFKRRGLPLWAQPGVEHPIEGASKPPSAGSCLLYGDSGLPTTVGPLAPDKIVLRGGWSDGDPYLLWNLRFEGWHRYRATGTIALLRGRGESLVIEAGGAPFRFVPLERRLFRDKRIPRENLNGILVPPTGLSAVLSILTGFGGDWAQDPPRLARVERFETDPDGTVASATLERWRGWTARRTVLFRNDGLVVVLDDAEGPHGPPAAVTWHIVGEREPGRGRLSLGAGGAGELAIVPLDSESGELSVRPEEGRGGRLGLLYRSGTPGRLRLASVFLLGPWRGARLALARKSGKLFLDVRGQIGRIRILLGPDGWSPSTDATGMAAVVAADGTRSCPARLRRIGFDRR